MFLHVNTMIIIIFFQYYLELIQSPVNEFHSLFSVIPKYIMTCSRVGLCGSTFSIVCYLDQNGFYYGFHSYFKCLILVCDKML